MWFFRWFYKSSFFCSLPSSFSPTFVDLLCFKRSVFICITTFWKEPLSQVPFRRSMIFTNSWDSIWFPFEQTMYSRWPAKCPQWCRIPMYEREVNFSMATNKKKLFSNELEEWCYHSEVFFFVNADLFDEMQRWTIELCGIWKKIALKN